MQQFIVYENLYATTVVYLFTSCFCAMDQSVPYGRQFLCVPCNKFFRSKKGLEVHVRTIHGISAEGAEKPVEKMACQELGCLFRCGNLSVFRQHLTVNHGHTFTELCQQFTDGDQFVKWLRNFEKRNDVAFYRSTMNVNANSRVVYYKCNRSGFYKRTKRKRMQRCTKAQGSCKIGGYCTAYIKTKEDFNTGVVTMYICNTHYGHDLQLEHLRVPKEDKRLIAEKLTNGLDLDEVIEQVKKTKPPNAQRTNLIKQKDVYNMLSKLGMKPKLKSKKSKVLVSNHQKLDMENNTHIEHNEVSDVKTQILSTNEEISNELRNDFIPRSDPLLLLIKEKRLAAVQKMHEVIETLQMITDIESLVHACDQAEALNLFLKYRLSSGNYIANNSVTSDNNEGNIVQNDNLASSDNCLPVGTIGVLDHSGPGDDYYTPPIDVDGIVMNHVTEEQLTRISGYQQVSSAKHGFSIQDQVQRSNQYIGEPESLLMNPAVEGEGFHLMVDGNCSVVVNQDQTIEDELMVVDSETRTPHDGIIMVNAGQVGPMIDMEGHAVGDRLMVTPDEDQFMIDRNRSIVDQAIKKFVENEIEEPVIADNDHLSFGIRDRLLSNHCNVTDQLIEEDSSEECFSNGGNTYLLADNEEIVQVLSSACSSFSKDGKTCFIYVDGDIEDREINIVETD